MTKKTLSKRELYKAEVEHIVKESCGTSLLELDEDCVITGINPDLDEISLMNQIDFVMKKNTVARLDDVFIDINDLDRFLT